MRAKFPVFWDRTRLASEPDGLQSILVRSTMMSNRPQLPKSKSSKADQVLGPVRGEVRRWIEDILNSKLSDYVLTAVKAGLHYLAPHWGGAVATLIEDCVPSSTERAAKRSVELLGQRLNALELRIDVQSVNKNEVADLFKSFRAIAERTEQEEKLQAAASLLASVFLKPGDPAKVTYTELDHLMRCVEHLSSGAIMVLGAARHLVTTAHLDQWGNSRIMFSDLQRELKNMDAWLLMGLVSELDVFNLLRVETSPAISMPHFGNYPLHLTPLGKRFVVQFIEGNMPAPQ
jgi:hypothetical protein